MLSERERKILGWQTDGISVREMGKHLGISHPMVVKIIKKIRAKCQKLLEINLQKGGLYVF